MTNSRIIVLLPGVRNKLMRLTDSAETAVLNQIIVRQMRPEQQARWDQSVSEHHYLVSERELSLGAQGKGFSRFG